MTDARMAPEHIARVETISSRIQVEVLISDELDREAVSGRIAELTGEYFPFPWRLLVAADLQRTVDEEYDCIGEV